MKWPDDSSDYFLKPMNCPHHHKVYAFRLRSYRELPLRFAEYGQVYRFENSGSLRGLSRVRGLCQNDAHIYLDPDDAKSETLRILDLHESSYAVLGLKGYRYRLSKCDPSHMENFDGSIDLWLQAEEVLRQCLKERHLEFDESVGDAAFYGPKIDVQIKMKSGVEESIASAQLDFNSGQKFALEFIAADGNRKIPWIIHRAPLGSHERFIALLLEYYDGQFPGWLAPIQVYVLPVAREQMVVANEFAERLRNEGIRVVVDSKEGSLSKRLHFVHRLRPFARVVLGDKEVQQQDFVLEFRGQKIKLSLKNGISELKELLRLPGDSRPSAFAPV